MFNRTFSRFDAFSFIRSLSHNLPLPTLVDHTIAFKWDTGTVKFFNEEKGFGFISRPGQPDLFFHASTFTSVSLDEEGLTLKFNPKKMEEKTVEAKYRQVYDSYLPYEDYYYWDSDLNWDDYQDSRRYEGDTSLIERPKISKRIQCVVLPRTPKKGDKIVFSERTYRGRNQAENWMMDTDLLLLRTKLESAYETKKEGYNKLKKYKVERVTLVKGKPVANNAKRCFECTITEHREVLFEGNNIAVLRETLKDAMIRHRSEHEVDYQVFVFEDEWVRCKTPEA